MRSLLSRRHALRISASATALPLVHIRTVGAAGKLAVAFWDHWVPGGNSIMQQQVHAWAAYNKVDVHLDFIITTGNQLLMTGVAESQANAGHDLMTFENWDIYNVARSLATVDDVVLRLVSKYGAASSTSECLGKASGAWLAVPSSSGTQNKPPCARISLMRKYGLDVRQMYPARPEETASANAWTYDTMLTCAEAAYKDGKALALGLGGGNNVDGIDQVGAMFHAFGAALVDSQGNPQLRSDAVQQVLEYAARLVEFLPADVVSYDDASNNRALIADKTALIFNPPSAWAVAKRDVPAIAVDCWTMSAPAGPKGRFVPALTCFWGIWKFSKNQMAAKELIEHLMQREQVEARDNAVVGYDLPPFATMNDFGIWESAGPPAGTLYNYPIRPWHDAKPSVTASEAPPHIAVQIYERAVHTGMLARLKAGWSVKQVLAWAERELEGCIR